MNQFNTLLDTELNVLDENFRTSLFARTEGHPLFTVELLREMQERGNLVKNEQGYWEEATSIEWNDLPARVEGVIEERIERLTDEHREILSVASVEGQDFTVQILARLQEIRERDLLRSLSRELEKRHQLVHETGEVQVGANILSRYTFSHALFQRYLYNSLSVAEKRLLHAELADILEELYAGQLDQVASQLAKHYTESGKIEKAVQYLQQAGRQALQVSAYREAETLFEQGLNLIQRQSTPEFKAFVLAFKFLLATSYESKGEYVKASEFLDKGLTLSRELNDYFMIADILVELGRVSRKQGFTEKGIIYLEEALEAAEHVNYMEGKGRAFQQLGVIYGRLGQSEKALEYYKQALLWAHEVGNLVDEAGVLNLLGVAYRRVGQFKQALDYYERGLSIAREVGDRSIQGMCLGNIAGLYRELGQVEKAFSYRSEALSLALKIGSRSGQAYRLEGLGNDYIYMENYNASVESLTQAIDIADEIGLSQISRTARNMLSRVFLHTDQHLKALKTLEDAEKYQHQSDHHTTLRLKAIVLFHLSRKDEARITFDDALKEATERLAKTHDLYALKFTRGIAFCGLAVLSQDEQQQAYVNEALAAYQAAIENCNIRGVVFDALRLFSELARLDTDGVLAPVRSYLESALSTSAME